MVYCCHLACGLDRILSFINFDDMQRKVPYHGLVS
jgi:hypothetical protein